MKTIFILPLLLLTACASHKPVVTIVPRSVPGTVLSADGVESVRYSENIKAYNIGRYIDPNNPWVMHERHAVYRVETTAKWNLHPNVPATVCLGPPTGIIDPARKDAPVTAEIVAEVNKQKAATQSVIEQGSRLNETLSQLSTALNASKEAGEQNVQLKRELDMTTQRLDLLEAELRRQQKESPASSGIPQTTNQPW